MVFRQKKSSVFDARAKIKVILIIILLCLAFLLLNRNGMIKLVQEKREHQELIEKKAELEATQEELLEEKERLLNDKKYIEKIAREQYNMVLPGETVYKVIEEE
ncbi:MAG: septum formation initiator family protein [Candidatus Marinimicrobia bacterium]|nr:septum formation initiator family protein [Candidatus Neomarinimicrobiota bacterium]